MINQLKLIVMKKYTKILAIVYLIALVSAMPILKDPYIYGIYFIGVTYIVILFSVFFESINDKNTKTNKTIKI